MHSLYRAYYFKWRCLYNSRLGVHRQSERNRGRVCGIQSARERERTRAREFGGEDDKEVGGEHER